MLIGDFGMVARLGLRELLEDDGLEVVAEAQLSVEIIPWVNEVRPDVVMLDLDADAALEVAARIASEFPAIKVIACSAEEPVMRVFPRSTTESPTLPLSIGSSSVPPSQG